jgi:hypothetical protein
MQKAASNGCLFVVHIVAVCQRKYSSDEVTPGLWDVFKTPLGGGVGNSGGGALGLRSGNYVGRGPLQPANAVFRWQSCRKPGVNSALPVLLCAAVAKKHATSPNNNIFARLRSLRFAQAHHHLRGRRVTEW